MDPSTIPSWSSSPAERHQKTNSVSCPREAARCRHVSQAVRIAMPSSLQASRPVRRVGMSPLSRPESPPAALVQTPNAFQMACRFAEIHFRVIPLRSAEVSPLFQSRNPLRWIPGPSQRSALRRRVPNLPPAIPGMDCFRNPDNGICQQQTVLPKERIEILSVRNSVCRRSANPRLTISSGMLRIFPPGVSKCSAVVVYADCTALERLPDLVCPP